MGREFYSLLPVLHPRSQFSPHGGGNKWVTNQQEVLFEGKELGNVWKRRRSRGSFLGDSQDTGPKPVPARACGSRDRSSSWEWPFPPSDVLWPLGLGCKARAGRTQRWPLSFLLCLFPGTSPGRGRARHGLQDHPSPRPVTRSGSQRRRTSAERQASVVATAVLTILSLGSAQSPQSPPPSLPHASRRPAHLAQNQWKGRSARDRSTGARAGPYPP